jgi:hypothetical protein
MMGDFVVFSKGENTIPSELYAYISDVLMAQVLYLG